MAKLANPRMSNHEFRFVIRQAPSDTLPMRDYSDFKSDSQLSFTGRLESVEKFPLYLVMVLVILHWINFINGLKEAHAYYYHNLQTHIRCVIPDLEKSNWTFNEIKNISHYSNSTNICYYYNHRYKLLSTLLYHEATKHIQNFNNITVNICSEYIFDLELFFFKFLTEQNAVCEPRHLDLYQYLQFIWIILLIPMGFLSDIYGRKPIILVTFGILFLSCTMLLFTKSHWISLSLFLAFSSSFAGLFLLGLILSIELVNGDVRNYLVGLMNLGISIGIITKILIYNHIEDRRLSNLAIYCTFLVPLHCLWLIPESPRWLLCYKKWPELDEILCNMNYQIKHRGFKNTVYVESNSEPRMSFLRILKTLLKPIFLRRCFGYGLLLGVVHYIFARENNRTESLLNSENALIGINLLCIGVSSILIPIVLNRISRPMALCICFLILSMIYSGTSTYKNYIDVETTVACFCLVISNNALLITYIISVEMFHTKIRVSAVTISHAIASTIIQILTILDKDNHFDNIFGMYEWTFISGILLICAISCSLIEDTGSVPIADTEYQAIFHF